MPSNCAAISKKLLHELATLSSSEINSPFSTNDFFGKLVIFYEKNDLTILRIFLVTFVESSF